ncbi:hypothetical protein GUJ93_ZPchr0125g33409 [Zizania palustris]|uniref:Uncharacterized protein n=1 Tax=Zizania palustris TaxID=103762 RepID=A0A8J5REP9_ZIZPA|nr:hypothetical protein GUJ93_ZPchr0125g33409 [Zizania palustris]
MGDVTTTGRARHWPVAARWAQERRWSTCRDLIGSGSGLLGSGPWPLGPGVGSRHVERLCGLRPRRTLVQHSSSLCGLRRRCQRGRVGVGGQWDELRGRGSLTGIWTVG